MSDNYTFWYYTPQGGQSIRLPSNILRVQVHLHEIQELIEIGGDRSVLARVHVITDGVHDRTPEAEPGQSQALLP